MPVKSLVKSLVKAHIPSPLKSPPFELVTIPPLQVSSSFRVGNMEKGIKKMQPQDLTTLEIGGEKKTPVAAKKKKTMKPVIKASKSAVNRAKPSIKKKVTSLEAPKAPSSFSDVHEGDRLGIYWPLDRMYYPGTVRDISGQHAMVHYDDGEFEWVDLLSNKFFKWKEGLAKQLRPADVLKTPPMSTTTIPLKPPPGCTKLQTSPSIQTSASSGESSGDASPKPSTPGPFFMRGTFKPKPVSSKSLVSFLRKKLHADSASNKPAALC
jgi:hypothetical protein